MESNDSFCRTFQLKNKLMEGWGLQLALNITLKQSYVNVEATSYFNVETTSDFNVETTSDFNVETRLYFNVEITSYFNVDSI